MDELLNQQQLPHYVGPYLTHWTGKDKSEEQGFSNLKSIIESQKLYLNRCHHFSPSRNCEAFLKMVCFTDIPHYLSEEHCKRYGKFGIVFKKENLIKYGANPVLYITERNKAIAANVYNFICNSLNDNKIEGLKTSLKSLFGYVQECNNPYTDKDLYYEREWRILENSIELQRNKEILPGEKGQLNNEQYYMQFSKDDIKFIVCPNEYVKKIREFFKNHIFVYEDYIKKSLTK